MNPTERFMAYAADFEESFIDDDWSRVEKHFCDDAVYEVKGLRAFTCKISGPAAIAKGFKKSLDGFDRKLDSRVIEVISEPEITDDGIALDWRVTYTKGDAPPFILLGHSYGRVKDGKIVELVDSYTPEMEATAMEWAMAYAPELDGAYV